MSGKNKYRVIFDASVLVTGYTAASHHKTGLFRVSYELLKQLVRSGRYEIHLHDIFFRERELIRFVQSEFRECGRIRIYSTVYSFIFFPLGNLTDRLRNYEHSAGRRPISLIAKALKNILLLIEKMARKIEKILNPRFRSSIIFSDFDIYYSTYFPVPEAARGNLSLMKVFTVHDLIPIVHPEYFSSSFNTILVREVIDNIAAADYVICVSESTRRDLLSERSDIDPDRVFIAHLAAADCFRPENDPDKFVAVRSKYRLPAGRKYILSACTFEPRKNLKTLISAWESILQEDKSQGFILVLAGAPYWEKDPLLEKIDGINHKYGPTVFITGYTDDQELALLYNDAYVFVYPSFYEGFGLPPVEAMRCGVPVICSDSSSLPEVVGDSGILTAPGDSAQLAEALTKLMSDPAQRAVLSEKAFLQASLFSWEKTSGVVERVFELSLSNG